MANRRPSAAATTTTAGRAAHRPLPPGSTVGILGGGQLGRMLAIAAARLGLKTHIYSDGRDACAFDVAHAHTIGDYDDVAAVEAFARHVDVVTYEFENVPLEAAAAAERAAPVRPGPRALAAAQDRIAEKTYIAGLGLPVAPFAAVTRAADFESAAAAIPGAAILKTSRLGYDGKGQARLESATELAAAFAALGGVPCVLEGLVRFDCEVSMLVVRDGAGAKAFWDPPRNRHEDGILRRSTVPAGLAGEVVARAEAIAGRIADGLDYVGVLAVELFYVAGGGGAGKAEPLIVNEIAPRVHNSGHWTIEACATSQFENHIRAVAGWPLGAVVRHADAEMVNLIGPEADAWPALAAEAGVHLHLYGKGQARPARKMGHVTRLRPLGTGWS